MTREFEVYVVDAIKASIWWQAPVQVGQVLSRVTDTCEVANCRACGVYHGVAKAEVLEANGLAARPV